MISRQGSLLSSMLQGHSHPQKIGPWKLGKTLGRGATGRVLLGVHHTTGQKAAVKVVSKLELNEEYEQSPDKKGALPYGIEREIIIMKLLTHPNVLRLYDVWETSKALYLVLEYVEGGELFDLLVERGPLQEQEAVKYFRQIILGTAYCHALGICHRDLKPENLLLDASLNVKLADFGMAALESNGKLLETSCGSPHYAAPEIVSGLKYHGAASDVWSCGVILFALLTGRLPFDDENIRNLLLKVQAGLFEMPDNLSREARDLIWRMLAVDPMERLATADVLNHPLLRKYPVPNEDLISVKSLPHPETAYKSLGSKKNIDPQILENLSILWNQRPQDDIIQALLTEGSNPEKTFYALLLRYRHSQDDSTLTATLPGSPTKRIPRSSSSVSNRVPNTPRRGKGNQISASNPRNRPVSFQRRYGARNSMVGGRNSAYSSVNNSPFKSPRDNRSMSPSKSPHRRPGSISQGGPLPRNIYNEIMNATPQNQSFGSIPPTLPSKDSIYAPADTPATTAMGDGTKPTLDAAIIPAPLLLPNNSRQAAANNKRNSILKNTSGKIARRKSIRQSLTLGLKRNSITVKLLSTYAKLASETDWEYMDKQTKRTSATFGTLCDKIFNHEDYNENDELLIDEEEVKAREYERLMELERKKHEAELKARKELAKQKKRQSRRSLFSSSRKLAITVTEDDKGPEETPTEEVSGGILSPPKRQSKANQTLRALSEGAQGKLDELTTADLEALKKRSVTQPVPRRRLTPLLTRRPVSRLDPLWIAHENKELSRAQDALQAEYNDMEKQRKKVNRESMVSFNYNDDDRLSKNSEYDTTPFELPEHRAEDLDLSEEYMSEIRKSRLLNSQYNLNGAANGTIEAVDKGKSKRQSTSKPRSKSEDRKTLIGSVHIPQVARKSSNFTASNKRLSLLTIRSTKESYRDLNSFLDTHNEDLDEEELNEVEQLRSAMPAMRTSFADRLDKAGSAIEDEDALESASVIDFDEHLASKRTSYYAGSQAQKRKSIVAERKKKLIEEQADADYTFAEDEADRPASESDVFDNIKLPERKLSQKEKKKASRVSAAQPSATTMLMPNLDNLEAPHGKKPQAKKNYGKLADAEIQKPKSGAPLKGPLADSTNLKPKNEDVQQKRNRSIFRKLSWGTKKLMDEESNKQLPSPVESNSGEEKKGGLFTRLFSSSQQKAADIHRYETILPKQEMMTALFALLQSWSNFGLKSLRKELDGYNITGAVSSNNSFNFKSSKFRIKIAQREMNQKSEVICVHVKGSSATSATLFKEISKVLEKEGVLDQ